MEVLQDRRVISWSHHVSGWRNLGQRVIARWKTRFVEGGVLALVDVSRAGRGQGVRSTTG
jgi:hypothetical protein